MYMLVPLVIVVLQLVFGTLGIAPVSRKSDATAYWLVVFAECAALAFLFVRHA